MKNTQKKLTAIALIFLMLAVAGPSPARADSWGSNMGAAIWKQTTEKMLQQIKETLIANLKIAAIRIIQAKLVSLLGSKNNSGMGYSNLIINDWKMFIYGSAMQYSVKMTNDFFNGLKSGTPSALNRRVNTPAQQAVMFDPYSSSFRPNLQNYVSGGDASRIFTPGMSQNPWMAWNAAAQPQNDLAFTYLRGMALKQSAYQAEAEAKKAEGVAGQGFKGKEAKSSTASKKLGGGVSADQMKGKITTPGSAIGSLSNTINGMSVNMLSLARSIPEIATAMVSQMMTQMIQQGVSKMIDPNYKNSMGMGSYGSSMGMPYGSYGSMGTSYGSYGLGQSQSLIQGGYGSNNMFFGR